MEEWVPAGAHVCAATGFRDVDPDCATAFDKWAVGWYERDLAWVEGRGGRSVGEVSGPAPFPEPTSTETSPPRSCRATSRVGRTPGERTIMTHMGMPALDAAVASLVYDLALEAGAGTWIEVF